MTSETQLKNEREKLFNQWRVLAEKVLLIGSIIQSSLTHTSYHDYLRAIELYKETSDELNKLWIDTNTHIQNNNYDRWLENGELK